LFGSSSSSQLDNDALLLDMGEYFVPALAPIIPAAASGSSSGTDGGGSTAASTGVGRILAAAGAGRAAVAAAAAATVSGTAIKADSKAGGGGGGTLVPQTLQLYSISPRPLADRAKAWGSGLHFKQASEVMARPFFDAPGASPWWIRGNTACMLLLHKVNMKPGCCVMHISCAVLHCLRSNGQACKHYAVAFLQSVQHRKTF
jgi:hypothetical protein